MANNNNRDRLIATFMSRTRKRKGPLDQGFPSNPGTRAGYRPQKQVVGKVTGGSGPGRPQDLEAAKQYAAQQARKRKQARY